MVCIGVNRVFINVRYLFTRFIFVRILVGNLGVNGEGIACVVCVQVKVDPGVPFLAHTQGPVPSGKIILDTS